MTPIIKNAPHGFTTYKGLCRRIGSGGEFVFASESAKRELIDRLVKLEDKRFFPYDGITEDLMASAKVSEIRRFPNGDLFVGYEVRVLNYGGRWDGPYQLLVHWGARRTLRAYTIIYGQCEKPCIAANMHIDRGNLVKDVFTESKQMAVSFLKDMRSNESLLIGNDNCSGEFITFGYEDGKLLMSWQVGNRPWGCNSTRGISIKEAVRAVSVFARRGIVGIQELGDWEGVEHYDSVSKKTTIDIDLCLQRYLLRAIRTSDLLLYKTLRAIGVNAERSKERPCEVMVGYGSREKMLGEAFAKAIPWTRKQLWRRNTKEARRINKILTYLSLQGHKPACQALSERFRLGDTLPENGVLAEYWNGKGA